MEEMDDHATHTKRPFEEASEKTPTRSAVLENTISGQRGVHGQALTFAKFSNLPVELQV